MFPDCPLSAANNVEMISAETLLGLPTSTKQIDNMSLVKIEFIEASAEEERARSCSKRLD